ncbi:MAG: NUDIX hydrolase [Candidatus Harrisonbacteria bacterium]|nr:NUDIX hydrolase [Candidatus Harrisonbacteria bacterium]
MTKTCDNASVGTVILDKNGNFLMIERKNYPQCFALPAGHLDGDDPEFASKKECEEEVGIKILKQRLLFRGRINNPCRRGASYHDFWGYIADEWSGEPVSGSDAKSFFWASPEKLRKLASRTELFFQKRKLQNNQVGELTRMIFGDPASPKTDPEWLADPGLEPVWYFLLKSAKVL